MVTPLSDLRVIELGQLIAGPFCGQILADFGAEVIKCELPVTGDPMREWGREHAGGRSLWWPVLARNKKSVTLNLRDQRGRDLLRRLLADADILIENFRPGRLESWGLSPEKLHEENPRLIIVRVSGFGQNGPYASRPGFGSIGEAMGGLRFVVGDPSTPPSRMGVSIGDSLAALFATIGALVALHERSRSGRGQVVDSAIYEAVLGIMESLVTEYGVAGHIRQRTGSILPNVAPSNVYPTSDGKMILIAANQDNVFARLAAAMGRPELASDERFSSHGARGRHQKELDDLISEWTAQHTAADLERILVNHAVPVGSMFTAADMLADEHFAAREAIVRVPHPELGELPMQNVFPKLSRTPGAVRWPGPELGQHNRQVYCGTLGLSEAEFEEMKSEGVI